MSHELIIIQARLGSSRLPKKILMPFWNGKSILQLIIEKVRALNLPFILATTNNDLDDEISDWAVAFGVKVYRGEEKNVLHRFIEAATESQATNLIRICADNPFIQLETIPHYFDELAKGIDYISYSNHQQVPAIRTHWGLFVEGVSLQALMKAQELIANDKDQRFFQEHVTNFIYQNDDLFTVKLEKAPKLIEKREDLRFTVDTETDFKAMSQLQHFLNSTEVTLSHLIQTVDQNPYLLDEMKKGIESFNK